MKREVVPLLGQVLCTSRRPSGRHTSTNRTLYGKLSWSRPNSSGARHPHTGDTQGAQESKYKYLLLVGHCVVSLPPSEQTTSIKMTRYWLVGDMQGRGFDDMRNALCGLVLLATCAAAQTVEGTVVDSATGIGVAAVRVLLLPVTGPASAGYFATTDALGRFVLDGVKTGAYKFSYALPGWSNDPTPPSRQVQINGDGKPVKLEGRMTALPRISGRVVDGNGKGITNAVIEIIGRNDPPVISDATGKFELRLDRGAYILSVLPPTGLKPPDPEPHSDEAPVWTRTFYPGVDRPGAASRIVLRPGSQLSGIEVKLLTVPSHAVRGVLLNPDDTPAPKATITLGEDHARTLRTQTNSDGAFEFPRVADGEWRLAAEVGSDGDKRRATQWIDMTDHELGRRETSAHLSFYGTWSGDRGDTQKIVGAG
jgi:hypothetical protein